MVAWHSRLNGHELVQTPGDSRDNDVLQSMGVSKSWTLLSD